MSKERSIGERMYTDEVCAAVVRLIGYAGCPYRELWEKLKPLTDQYGQPRVETATVHLLTYEGQFRFNPPPLADVKLRADVRKLAFGLLGPPPEHPWYAAWKSGERIPLPWERPAPTVTERKEEPTPEEPPEEPTPSEPGIPQESYAHGAQGKNRRQLLCMLRDARRKLARNGKRSFAAKEAKKEIAAAEAELRRRGLDIPPEGQETAEWDKAK